MAEPNVVAQAEEWRPIPGFGDQYAASSFGRIKRTKPRKQGGRGPSGKSGHIFSPCLNKRIGYLMVSVYPPGEDMHINLPVHRLVALAFLGAPPADKPSVDHISGNKTDNRPENLRWCSVAENNRFHRDLCGIRPKRPDVHLLTRCQCGGAKLSWDKVAAIQRMIRQDLPLGWKKQIAREYGVTPSAISKVLSRKGWKNEAKMAPQPSCNSVANSST